MVDYTRCFWDGRAETTVKPDSSIVTDFVESPIPPDPAPTAAEQERRRLARSCVAFVDAADRTPAPPVVLLKDTIEVLPELTTLEEQCLDLRAMVNECHGRSVNAGWYRNPVTGDPLSRNVPETIALIHSEVSEALEGYRKAKQDDHLPHRQSIEVELADVLIRVFDLAGYLNLDLGGAYLEKLEYNETRADHSAAARAAAGGKRF